MAAWVTGCVVSCAALVAVAPVACGGSSSESPWPVEPIETPEGPLGEEYRKDNVVDVRKLPDAYSDRGGSDGGGSGGAPSEQPDPDLESEPEPEP